MITGGTRSASILKPRQHLDKLLLLELYVDGYHLIVVQQD